MPTLFMLPAKSPFQLALTVWALRRRESNIIDKWDGYSYKRLFVIDNQPLKVTILQVNNKKAEITVSTDNKISKKGKTKLTTLLIDMLGLSQDLSAFYRLAKKDRHLQSLVAKFKGVKAPRFPSLFETLCNAIACQQISIDAGLHILNRFAQHYGKHYQDDEITLSAFPLPEDIYQCRPSQLRKLGFSTRKSETIIRIAKNMCEHEHEWNNLVNLPDNEIMKFLCAIKGIGRWTAEYTLLRGLGRINVFPGDDIGAQKNMQQYLHVKGTINHSTISTTLAHLTPYAGMVYFHLLLQKLEEKSYFI